jgi:hypothetical protein
MPQPESPWAKSSYDDYDYTVSLDTQTRILQGDALALEAIRNLHLDENAPSPVLWPWLPPSLAR